MWTDRKENSEAAEMEGADGFRAPSMIALHGLKVATAEGQSLRRDTDLGRRLETEALSPKRGMAVSSVE